MFVKFVRVSGFKSFATPTVLEFEPGVNVIVGPNGSGKSNIVDALAWVLGSQAPTSLRGASMEDVIFAGSADRPRLGIAEVELTLDNSSGVLPLDVSEITVGRSTDRSGASEYRINGAPCRLLDVIELLSDTGLGRSLHTVVGQGQLDAVLQARPEERRAFIDEAAQIGKYRRRRERALKKIERVDQNLLRLNDVLLEVRRAARPLKRQASAAASYSELIEEQRTLKQRLAATDLHRLRSQSDALDVDSTATKEGLLRDELAHVRARLSSATGERDSSMAAAQSTQELAYRMSRVVERLSNVDRLARERSATLGARLAAETEHGYRERIELLESERRRWDAEARRAKADAVVAHQRASAAASELARRTTVVDEAERHLAEARSYEADAAQALVRAEGTEAAARTTMGSLEARIDAVLERREVAHRDASRRSDEIKAAEREVRDVQARFDATVEVAARAEARHDAARDGVEGSRERLAETRARRAAAHARLHTLEEVAALLVDVAEVQLRVEPLIRQAREQAHAMAAEEEAAAGELAAAQAGAERCWIEVAEQDEDLRRLDALMSGAAERLSGARRRYEAREIELAALDDELARLRESLAGAQTAALDDKASLPVRRAALDDARAARETADEALRAARTHADAAARAAATAEVDRRTAEERLITAELRGREADEGAGVARRSLAGLADRRAAFRAAQARADQAADVARAAVERATPWLAAADDRAAGAREAARNAEASLGALIARERELEDGLHDVSRRRNEAEVRRAEMAARRDAIAQRAMEEWGLSERDLLSLEPFDDEARAPALERLDHLAREMRRIGPVNPRAAEEYAEISERETFLVDQIEDLRASRRDLMKIVRDVDATIVAVFREAFDDAAREFERVFETLFPGGSGRLELTDPEDLLSTGVEIEARPAGKNVKKLSLLSGGERSLVTLAFLFSIFRARPSPFYLLDEVEAALDDVNLQRFLHLVQELKQGAQVLIVTHQKRTMEAADVLYGVTMAKDGVSRVIAKRMEELTV